MTRAAIGCTLRGMRIALSTAFSIAMAGDVAMAAPALPSVTEPGSLGSGELALRGGAGIGQGFLGVGVQSLVGLGGVDLVATASVLPKACIDLGELGAGCDPAVVSLAAGAQVQLHRSARSSLGVRAHGSASVAGDSTWFASAELVGTTGTHNVRLALAPILLAVREEGDPFDKNGLYLGGTVGVAYVSDGGHGFELGGGAARQLTTTRPETMPLVMISVWTR